MIEVVSSMSTSTASWEICRPAAEAEWWQVTPNWLPNWPAWTRCQCRNVWSWPRRDARLSSRRTHSTRNSWARAPVDVVRRRRQLVMPRCAVVAAPAAAELEVNCASATAFYCSTLQYETTSTKVYGRLEATFLADRINGRAYATVLRLSVCRLSVSDVYIVAKRCVLEQKLLLIAYRKSYMRDRLI